MPIRSHADPIWPDGTFKGALLTESCDVLAKIHILTDLCDFLIKETDY
jgi:hypothetical protein